MIRADSIKFGSAVDTSFTVTNCFGSMVIGHGADDVWLFRRLGDNPLSGPLRYCGGGEEESRRRGVMLSLPEGREEELNS